MASSAHKIGADFKTKLLKMAGVVLSDTANRYNSTGFAVITGTGAPSGAYWLTSTNNPCPCALYLREDGGVATALYVTADSGTTWTAMDPAALSSLDINGSEFILDADADTSITADTDDQIDIKISGADDFRMTANTFSVLSGSSLHLADSAGVKFGDAQDVVIAWDATDLAITQAAPNSAIKVGVDGAGMDLVLYGDTAGRTMTWDQSADSLIFTDNAKAVFGTGSDISVYWDATDLIVAQAAPNSAIKLGVDGAGIDLVLYGDTASASVTWDQSADKLILGGVAKIQFQTITAATGTAIPVTHSGSLAITQNGAETNTLADPTYLGQTISIFVDTDTSGARVITAASRINQTGNNTITLTEVGDFIKLEAITIGGALKWQVVANDGAALSTV